MSDSRMSRESREDALERILAETAKNPYTPKRPVRPAHQSGRNLQGTKRKVISHEKDVALKNTEDTVLHIPTEVQKAEEAKARAAKKIEEIKRLKELREKQIRPLEEHTERIYGRVEKKPQKQSEHTSVALAERNVRRQPVIEEVNKTFSLNRNEPDNSEKESEGDSIALDDILEIFESVLAVILVVTMIFTYIIRVAVVDGKSMFPTLEDNDKLIVRSIGYTPDNGDIVVIDNENTHLISETGKVIEGEGLDKVIVKRVIAKGGQTIDIDFETGIVTVDGEQLDEKYISEPTTRDEYAFTYPLTVPEGYIFVMGDNRNISKDSRHPEIGLIPEDSVVGKVVLRVYPFGKFGGIE